MNTSNFCPKCKRYLPNESDFCPYCGIKILSVISSGCETEKSLNNCDSKSGITDSSNVTNQNGESLNNISNSGIISNEADRSNKVFLISLAIVILIIVGYVGFVLTNSHQETQSEKFYDSYLEQIVSIYKLQKGNMHSSVERFQGAEYDDRNFYCLYDFLMNSGPEEKWAGEGYKRVRKGLEFAVEELAYEPYMKEVFEYLIEHRMGYGHRVKYYNGITKEFVIDHNELEAIVRGSELRSPIKPMAEYIKETLDAHGYSYNATAQAVVESKQYISDYAVCLDVSDLNNTLVITYGFRGSKEQFDSFKKEWTPEKKHYLLLSLKYDPNFILILKRLNKYKAGLILNFDPSIDNCSDWTLTYRPDDIQRIFNY